MPDIDLTTDHKQLDDDIAARRYFAKFERITQMLLGVAEEMEAELRGVDADRFPNLTQHFHLFADRALSIRWSDSSQRSLDDSYEFLIQLLLDGIARQVEALPSGDPPVTPPSRRAPRG